MLENEIGFSTVWRRVFKPALVWRCRPCCLLCETGSARYRDCLSRSTACSPIPMSARQRPFSTPALYPPRGCSGATGASNTPVRIDPGSSKIKVSATYRGNTFANHVPTPNPISPPSTALLPTGSPAPRASAAQAIRQHCPTPSAPTQSSRNRSLRAQHSVLPRAAPDARNKKSAWSARRELSIANRGSFPVPAGRLTPAQAQSSTLPPHTPPKSLLQRLAREAYYFFPISLPGERIHSCSRPYLTLWVKPGVLAQKGQAPARHNAINRHYSLDRTRATLSTSEIRSAPEFPACWDLCSPPACCCLPACLRKLRTVPVVVSA
jgi:hypothetical protein